MSQRFTERDLQRMKQAGTIRDFKKARIPALENRCIMPIIPRPSPEKDWLIFNLQYFANDHALSFETEYKFAIPRKWAFDYAFTGVKIAVEYEGLFDGGKAHSSIGGILRDVEKYNKAQELGWIVLRVTAKEYKTVLDKIRIILKQRHDY
jgi:hypothetical protein